MIYYLRHGETIWNRAQRLQGRLDSPLTERGIEMFERARQFLAAPRDEDVSIVIGHGGLSRAIRGAYLRLPVEELNALPSHFHGRLYVLCEGRVREVVADGSEPPSETLLG